MKQVTVMEKYPVFTIEINKNETTYKNVDEVIAYLKAQIEAHPVAVIIGVFDHYSHTSSLEVGEIAESIKDAKNLICCFGKALPKPEVMAVRPRSFGVADMGESFVISFMEAPNPEANTAMEKWVKGVANN
ncbi:hypothetical protein MNB_SV-3-486 [hydrothermal vent metagenome]|uniref:Uncharacterized protein n=1 Tax=hydrothermal vent metagenome TaxID=652676 RepID=A0A1W1CCQ8_9ZZZZ